MRVAAGIGFASTSPGVRGFTAENKIFNRNIDTTDKEKVIYIWCNQAVKKLAGPHQRVAKFLIKNQKIN